MSNETLFQDFLNYQKTQYTNKGTYRGIRWMFNKILDHLKDTDQIDGELDEDVLMSFMENDYIKNMKSPSTKRNAVNVINKFLRFRQHGAENPPVTQPLRSKNKNNGGKQVTQRDNINKIIDNSINSRNSDNENDNGGNGKSKQEDLSHDPLSTVSRKSAPIPKIPNKSQINRIMPDRSIIKIYIRNEDDATLEQVGKEYTMKDIVTSKGGDLQSFIGEFFVPKYKKYEYWVSLIDHRTGLETTREKVTFAKPVSDQRDADAAKLRDVYDILKQQQQSLEGDVSKRSQQQEKMYEKMFEIIEKASQGSNPGSAMREVMQMQMIGDIMKDMRNVSHPMNDAITKKLERILDDIEKRSEESVNFSSRSSPSSPVTEMMQMKMMREIMREFREDMDENRIKRTYDYQPQPPVQPIPQISENAVTTKDVMEIMRSQSESNIQMQEKMNTMVKEAVSTAVERVSSMIPKPDNNTNMQMMQFLEKMNDRMDALEDRIANPPRQKSDLESFAEQLKAFQTIQKSLGGDLSSNASFFDKLLDKGPGLLSSAAKFTETAMIRQPANQIESGQPQQPQQQIQYQQPKQTEKQPQQQVSKPQQQSTEDQMAEAVMQKFNLRFKKAAKANSDADILKSFAYLIKNLSKFPKYQYIVELLVSDKIGKEEMKEQIGIYVTKLYADEEHGAPKGLSDKAFEIVTSNRDTLIKNISKK